MYGPAFSEVDRRTIFFFSASHFVFASANASARSGCLPVGKAPASREMTYQKRPRRAFIYFPTFRTHRVRARVLLRKLFLCGWGAPQLLEKVRYPSPPPVDAPQGRRDRTPRPNPA